MRITAEQHAFLARVAAIRSSVPTDAQIARRWGLSVCTIRTRLRRIRADFHDTRAGARGIDPVTPADPGKE